MRDGKANLSAPAPRASNGKPDLSGIWQAEGAPFKELIKYVPDNGVNGVGESDPSLYFFNVLADFKPEEAPLQPGAVVALRKQAEITIDDPKTYTRPFTYKFTDRLLPDTDLIESFCTENEKDTKHMAVK